MFTLDLNWSIDYDLASDMKCFIFNYWQIYLFELNDESVMRN